MKQLALDIASPPPPTLDNFVAGRNGELLDCLKQVVARQARERFVYIWGQPGSGRTHLLTGTATGLQHTGATAAYIGCSAGTRLGDELDRMDCVVLDDVDRLDGEGQVAAFSLYNRLRERGGALLAGGSAPPAQLKLRADLLTRLAWGLVYQVHALTDDEKSRALADYAAGRGFRLSPEVSEYLLRRASRDLSSLVAAVDALDRYSLETKRPVTVPLVRELLQSGMQRPTGPGTRDLESGG
jgi:DnaA family protein